MKIKKFDIENDLINLEEFLRNQYLENKNMTSWLPERLHDLIYRMDTQYTDAGKQKSSEYIFLWEDNNEIVACILPDGDAIYMSIKNGYEDLFESIVSYAEENCKPLFEKDADGSIDFLVIANDSLKYRKEFLEKNGYSRQQEEDYDNYVYPQNTDVSIDLPKGYKLVYGDEYTDEDNKWSACNLGFHPDLEDSNYRNDMGAYNSRKQSSMYKDSFECMIIDENLTERNDVCSYCFVYVDKKSKTAFVEPVSTREKYRHKGIGTAMMHGVMLKCKELGIEKCYVNSYDWRRKFYNAAGFITEDTIGFYHKKI
jgi:GNAT superfamily N-acetyltransferase